jgi:hypothetical protein
VSKIDEKNEKNEEFWRNGFSGKNSNVRPAVGEMAGEGPAVGRGGVVGK